MKKLITIATLILLIVIAIVAQTGCSGGTKETEPVASESWQIGENWLYSPQAVWGDTFVGVEYTFGNALEEQYISTYNLNKREKERVLKLDPAEYRISPPSIYQNRIVWSSANISGRPLSEIDWSNLNWDIYLLILDTGEVRQITSEEHAQIEPRIYGDTIIWLDVRYADGYHNPDVFDVYAYDLKTGQERRLTSSTSAEGHDLSISGNLVVWSDNRHAEWDRDTHPENEPNYNNEIYAYDLTANVEHRITNYAGNDHYPSIDGSRIVWLRQLTLQEAEIYLYDLLSSTGYETQVSKGRYAAYGPSISGDLVVWADARISQGNTAGDVVINGRSGAAEIYFYDSKDGKEILLVPSESEGEYSGTVFRRVLLNPMVHGDFVVYTNSRQIGPIIYAMRLDNKGDVLGIVGRPPWYYCFYPGGIWSIIILTIIVVGFLVFFVMRKKKNKKRGMIFLEWLGLGVALLCLLGYAFYFLYLMI